MSDAPAAELFKPIAVSYDPSPRGRLAFALRCLADLQTATIYGFLRRHLPGMTGAVLDVGCGESPYRHLLGPGCRYTGVDIEAASGFGMSARPEVVAFDGTKLPFPDGQFDHVLCTEVLEHVAEPGALVAEMHRVLKPGGSLVMTIPYSARVHHAPYDFQRFTRYGLARLFAGFSDVEIEPRGTDITAIAAKLVVRTVALSGGGMNLSLLWRVPLFVVLAPVAAVALSVAHVALAMGVGDAGDPLGYAGVCLKGHA